MHETGRSSDWICLKILRFHEMTIKAIMETKTLMSYDGRRRNLADLFNSFLAVLLILLNLSLCNRVLQQRAVIADLMNQLLAKFCLSNTK